MTAFITTLTTRRQSFDNLLGDTNVNDTSRRELLLVPYGLLAGMLVGEATGKGSAGVSNTLLARLA